MGNGCFTVSIHLQLVVLGFQAYNIGICFYMCIYTQIYIYIVINRYRYIFICIYTHMCVCACVKHEKCHDNSPEATKNFKILTQKLVAVEALAKAAWNLRSWPKKGQIRCRRGIFLGGLLSQKIIPKQGGIWQPNNTKDIRLMYIHRYYVKEPGEKHQRSVNYRITVHYEYFQS